MITVKLDTSGITQAIKLLAHIPGAYDRAANRALKRAMEAMKAETVRSGTAKYHIKAGEVRKTLTITPGSRGSMRLVSRGERKSLADYYMTPKRPGKHNKGIKAAVKRTGIKSLRGAFLVNIRGRYLPFVRVGRGKWDIRHLSSVAVPQIAGNEEVSQQVTDRGAEVFSERLNHEVMRELGVYSH